MIWFCRNRFRNGIETSLLRDIHSKRSVIAFVLMAIFSFVMICVDDNMLLLQYRRRFIFLLKQERWTSKDRVHWYLASRKALITHWRNMMLLNSAAAPKQVKNKCNLMQLLIIFL